MSHTHHGHLQRALATLLTIIASVALSAGVTSRATAATAPEAGPASTTATAERTHATAPNRTQHKHKAASRGARVVRTARAQAGDPYVYGAAGPNAFDCSGLTMYVYRVAAHKRLPHNSAAQQGSTRRITAKAARPGDLVFFHDGGGVYHVAIYAGHHAVWHAPYPGTRVRRERIWTSAVTYGRVR